MNEIDKLQTNYSNTKSQLEEERKCKKIAESKQDEAEKKARNIESTYNVLKEECDALHETIALKDTDIEELTSELHEFRLRRHEHNGV